MKVVISAQGSLVSSPVDSRFGRAPWFILADTETGATQAIENEQNVAAAQGAGIQSAQCAARLGAQAVITGHCGPKAFRVLRASGVRIYLGATGTVSDVLDKFKGGQLTEADDADVEGHWV